MRLEISKTDWSVPCKEIWSVMEAKDKQELLNEVKKLFVEAERLEALREFLIQDVYLNGAYLGRISDVFKIEWQSLEFPKRFSDEYDTEYSQYRREMQERLYR